MLNTLNKSPFNPDNYSEVGTAIIPHFTSENAAADYYLLNTGSCFRTSILNHYTHILKQFLITL